MNKTGFVEKGAWNKIVAGLSQPNILQTYEWGLVKSRFGWLPNYKLWKNEHGSIVAAALILERSISIGGIKDLFKVLYVPKGPVLIDWHDSNIRQQILNDLAELAIQKNAIFIKIDPNVCTGTGVFGTPNYVIDQLGDIVLKDLQDKGWRNSNEQVQFRNTVLIDLDLSEEELLSRMKQKTRYNVRLANRKGVRIRVGTSNDFDMLYQMYAETSIRDEFVIRERDYYFALWGTFYDAKMAVPLIAEVNDEPVAALILIWFQDCAYYMFGMSRQAHREKMPNYLLQWEAIKKGKELGCKVYDLWGAPDEFEKSDPMWGVYRFKEGLGGKVVSYIGAWDFTSRPYLYRVYTEFIPRLLGLMRLRGKARIRRTIRFEGIRAIFFRST